MKTKKCPFCAEEIRFEAIKCKHCGEFLEIKKEPVEKKEGIWICKKCSEEIEDHYEICWNCGADKEGKINKEIESEIHKNKVKSLSHREFPSFLIIIPLIIGFSYIGFHLGYFMYGRKLSMEALFKGSYYSHSRNSIIITTILGAVLGGIIGFLATNRKKK